MTKHNVASDGIAHDKLARLFGREPNANELEAAYLGVKMGQNGGDAALWVPRARVLKYAPGQAKHLTKKLGHEPTGPELRIMELEGVIEPDEVTECVGNLLTTAGLNRITNLIIGGGGSSFTQVQAFTGVGDSSTAATVADTTLNAATNKYYQNTDAANPTQSNGVITNNTTFAGANANYSWNEWVWGIATGTLTAGTGLPGTSPILLNHKVQSLGTKVSTAVWTLQATITLA